MARDPLSFRRFNGWHGEFGQAFNAQHEALRDKKAIAGLTPNGS